MEECIDKTDLLIERIKNWKAEKDEKEYRAKIEDEKKVSSFMEIMNSKILEDSKNILKVYLTLKRCEIDTGKFPCYNIKFAYKNCWCLRFEFRNCISFVYSNSKNISFKKKDSAGFSTDYDSDPPHSSEFNSFFDNFENFKTRFYDFVEQLLK